MATKTQIQKSIAQLESQNDQLVAEIHYIDELLKASGFPEGLRSLKSVACEMIESSEENSEGTDDENFII